MLQRWPGAFVALTLFALVQSTVLPQLGPEGTTSTVAAKRDAINAIRQPYQTERLGKRNPPSCSAQEGSIALLSNSTAPFRYALYVPLEFHDYQLTGDNIELGCTNMDDPKAPGPCEKCDKKYDTIKLAPSLTNVCWIHVEATPEDPVPMPIRLTAALPIRFVPERGISSINCGYQE